MPQYRSENRPCLHIGSLRHLLLQTTWVPHVLASPRLPNARQTFGPWCWATTIKHIYTHTHMYITCMHIPHQWHKRFNQSFINGTCLIIEFEWAGVVLLPIFVVLVQHFRSFLLRYFYRAVLFTALLTTTQCSVLLTSSRRYSEN